MAAQVDDTYAEAFRSLYSEILITCRDEKWLQHAINAVTGHASSTIMCDCEAGVDRFLDRSQTPDGRVGAIIQFHVPRFRKDRVPHLEKVLLARISQNILTCPTATCFNLLESDDYFRLGRKIAYFGDGFEKLEERHGRDMWVIPTMGGDFALDRRFGYDNGVMGGNLWFLARDEDSAIAAAEAAVDAVNESPGVISTFPGGVAASASKAGSRYSFLFASTFEAYCPTLKAELGEASQVPDEVNSIMEIIVNGRSLEAIDQATQAAIARCVDTPGLIRISAGNYNGRLGKSFIYLKPQPA